MDAHPWRPPAGFNVETVEYRSHNLTFWYSHLPTQIPNNTLLLTRHSPPMAFL